MSEHKPLFRSIVFSLFRHVFGAYVVVAVLVTAYQGWDEYQVTIGQNFDDLQDSAEVLQHGMANAVWHLDRPLIDDLITGILSRNKIVGVRVFDEHRQALAEQGSFQPDIDTRLVYRFELVAPVALSPAVIGSVELHSSRNVIFKALQPTYQALLLAAIVKTAALWFIFIYFGRRLLGLPLMKMAQNFDVQAAHSLASHLQPEQMNEIEQLSVAILNLQRSSRRLLTRSEKRLQQILDAAGEGMLVLDAKGLISYCNPTACELFGWQAAEMTGADPRDLFGRPGAGADTKQRRCEIQQVLQTGTGLERQDAAFWRKDGSSFPASFKSSPIMESGEVTGAVVVFQDISEQKQQEQILRQSRNTYQTLLDNLPERVVYKDINLVCISANRSFAESLGYRANEIPGKHIRELFAGEQAKRIEMTDWKVISSGQSIEFEDVQNHAEGAIYTQTISSPIFDHQQAVVGVLTIMWDITHLKLAEQERQLMQVQLNQAQKLESVGQLAAGIAHEINTPVQFVSDNTHFLKDAFMDIDKLLGDYRHVFESFDAPLDPAAIKQQLDDIEKEADLEYLRGEIPRAIEQSMGGLQRISKIVLAMKEFSHPGNNEKTPTDLNRAIQSTIDVSRNEWKYDSQLITEFDLDLPMVPVLPGEFNQVVLNLIINASHAIHDVHQQDRQGEIRISTRQAGQYVELRVSDNGCGIPAAIRKRIFDPFFTTKEVGKGTGQGLAIAYSAIVDKHAGSIEVESEENVGTTFIIRIPLHPLEAASGDPS